jgi:CHAD domain-containing protein
MEPDFVKLKQIKPALSGYIRKAENLLRSAEYPNDKTVHDVRVLMKKARAELKLTSSQIDIVFTEREIKSLREVGRSMNLLRENHVLRKTLLIFKKKYPEIFSRLADNEKLNQILTKPDSDQFAARPGGIDIDLLIENLNKTGFRVRFEPMTKLDPNGLFKGLEVTYNRVVNSYLISRNKSRQSTLHEFRKSAKDLLYQLYFFMQLNPSGIKTLEKRLVQITQNLGKYNDLAQLIKGMKYSYEYTANNPALDELVILIRKEQDKYLSAVWPAAYKVFCPGQSLVKVLGFKLLII